MRKVVEDVPYTQQQIKSLLDKATLRDRCIILLMASAGLRRGAIPGLRLKDLQKITQYYLYKNYSLQKRPGTIHNILHTRMCQTIRRIFGWRSRLGEILEPDSPLFRKEFDTTLHLQIIRPKRITAMTIDLVISRLLDRTGVRSRTHTIRIKTNLMQCHGFRKFFDTQCMNHNINPLYCEYLMGHKSGLIKSYFKPSDMELLEGNDKSLGYTAMIPYLTINATEEENNKLRQQVAELKEHHSKEWELMRQQVSSFGQVSQGCN